MRLTNPERSKLRQHLFSQARVFRDKYKQIDFNYRIAKPEDKALLAAQKAFCKQEIEKLLKHILTINDGQHKQQVWARGSKLTVENFLKGK